jgi:hypothetical protein
LRASQGANRSENQQLQEQMNVKTKDYEQLQKRLEDLEGKLELYRKAAEYAGRIRCRAFHDGIKGPESHAFIRDGNRAAHDGDCYLDGILFTLGVLDLAETALCSEKYRCKIQDFVGSDSTLKPLLDAPYRTRMYNLHFYIDSEIKRGIKRELGESLASFRALDTEIRGYLSSLEWSCATEEDALEGWENNADVRTKIEEMGEIVKRFQQGRNKGSKENGMRDRMSR